MKILRLLALCIALTACVSAPPVHIPEVPPPTRPIAKHMNVGLALGAGGAKGYAHLGVIAVLEEAGVPIDLIAGASAGSIVGTLYADTGSIEHTFHAMMTSDLADFLSIDLHIGGFASGNKLEKFVFEHLHATTFKQLKIPMLIATTDLVSGEEYTISSGPVAPAVLASATVPGLIRPSQLYGKRLVDGGVTDPIPVNLLLPYQPKLTIGVNISTELPKKVPTLALDVYHRAYAIMWNDLCEHTASLADVVIHPIIDKASMFDISKKMSLYHAGRTAAQQALPKILQLMRKKGIPLNKKVTRTTT